MARPALSNRSAQAAQPHSQHPFIGIGAVLIGALISTLYGRVTALGLADIRGAIGAGFDEGAWIPTAATVAQMFVGPPAAWLGVAFGVRRVLLVSATIFGLTSAAIPFAPSLATVLMLQGLAGLASGTFIPLTIGFVLQNLRPAWWPYGIAAYGLNLELSLNIPAALEGFYLDHLSWHWIFWQGSILTVPMIACIAVGMPRQAASREVLHRADGWGMAHLGIGCALLYAALDQGNRLDWLNSGTVVGLLSGGCVLLCAFVLREATCRNPWINLRFLAGRNIGLLVVTLVLYRLILLATSFLIPQYLMAVQNFRALQIGPVLLLIAIPQFALAPAIATILRFVEPRIVMAFGFATIGAACLMAMQLTAQWQTHDFLPSQILQALGQSSALIALVLFFVRHLHPAEALTFGAVLQTARLFGGEVGNAFMQTYVRTADQVGLDLLGLHVQQGSGGVQQRVDAVGAMLRHRIGSGDGAADASLTILAQAVRTQANVLSVVDGFASCVIASIGALALVALLRKPDA